MASAVVDCAWRLSSPEAIEEDLSALWKDAARDGPVARAVMSNLVVFSRASAGADAEPGSPRRDPEIEEIARRHPARVIVLHHSPHPPAGGHDVPTVHVGVLVFGPADARYGIEQMVIRCACSGTALPSIVRRLTRGDVPTSLWWNDDFTAAQPLSSVVTMGRQLVYDSRHWADVPAAVRTLQPIVAADDAARGPDLADLNWRRLTPFRQALMEVFGSPEGTRRPGPFAVRIGHRQGEAALAWLCTAWLTNFFSVGRVLSDPPVVLSDPPPRARSEGAAGPKGPALQEPAPLLTASFGDDLRLGMDDHRVLVEGPLARAPFTVPIPHETTSEALAAELRALPADTALRDVLRTLAARFHKA